MNNLAQEQLFELLVLFITAMIYIVAHFLCSGFAVLISGRKSGVIRGFLQGVLLVGLFATAIVLFFNGDLKVYHFFTYFAIVLFFVKIINWVKSKITLKAKPAKKDNEKGDKLLVDNGTSKIADKPE